MTRTDGHVPVFETSLGAFSISTNKARLDVTAIHSVLAQSYWSPGIPLETVQAAIDGSVCYGMFSASGQQVGFARLVTDRATFANLCDVFIIEALRGQGLGSWLISTIFSEPWLSRLRKITLATRDAHALYRPVGFTNLGAPQSLMEIVRPNIYQQP